MQINDRLRAQSRPSNLSVTGPVSREAGLRAGCGCCDGSVWRVTWRDAVTRAVMWSSVARWSSCRSHSPSSSQWDSWTPPWRPPTSGHPSGHLRPLEVSENFVVVFAIFRVGTNWRLLFLTYADIHHISVILWIYCKNYHTSCWHPYLSYTTQPHHDNVSRSTNPDFKCFSKKNGVVRQRNCNEIFGVFRRCDFCNI